MPSATGGILLGALLLGLEYGMKSAVCGLPKIKARYDRRIYWAVRLCSLLVAIVLLGSVFSFGSWIPLVALAYAAVASVERPLAVFQRYLFVRTGSYFPWLQITPMLLLAALASGVSRYVGLVPGPLSELVGRLISYMPAFAGSVVDGRRIAEYAAIYILVSQPANHVIRCLLGRGLDVEPWVVHVSKSTAESTDESTEVVVSPSPSAVSPEGPLAHSPALMEPRGGVYADVQTLRAGRAIGILERWIIVTFVVLGQFGSVGLILTAKSIVRFAKFEHDPEFAEYYLLGTLYSILVSLLAGLMLKGGGLG